MIRSISFSYAIRTLRRSPIFAATVILSLAVGIGGNAAIFSIVNALFLHPAGIDHPAQVVAPRISYKKLRLDRIDMSVPDFADVRDSPQMFSSAAMSNIVGLNYAGNGSAQRLQGAAVTWRWFDVFGARPIFGRGFRAADDQPGSNQVIVLSFDLWKRMFGAQQSALGKTVELDRKLYRVVGVMPSNFRWPSQADFWMPLGLANSEYAESNRFNESHTVVARLRPGISLAQCAHGMQAVTEHAKSRDKDTATFANVSQWSMQVESLTELTSGDLRTSLLILSGAVGLVLLLACSNIARLMLVRSSARSRELAIRTALGASTADLLLQALIESLLLAFTGTLLGLLSVSVFLKALLFLAPSRMTAGLVIEPDLYVVLFTMAAGMVSALFFGLLPAWQASRLGSQYESLKAGGRSDTEGIRRQRVRAVLVVGQVAVALVLLLSAGLLLKSLSEMHSTNLGFDPTHVMTAAVSLPDSAYKEDAKQIALFRSVIEDLKTKPGVIAVAAADPVPFNGDHGTASFEVEGRLNLPGDPGPHGYRGYVSPNYFGALRIPLLEGRDFTDADRIGTQPVVIIDENLAREYWANKNPIGRKLRNNISGSPWAIVIGVVKHVRAYNFAAGDTRGIYYYPIYQHPVPYMNFVVRTTGNPRRMITAMEQAVHRQDPSQAVFDIATPAERISKALGPQQFAVDLLSAFAAIALLLAALGLYGVVSFGAGQRTREIGIRSALGADRLQILTMIAAQGLRLIVVGLFLGGIVASLLARTLATRFEHTSLDPVTFLMATLVLGFVAVCAAIIPAWRATALDPLSALRQE